jgi:hypothetical protein
LRDEISLRFALIVQLHPQNTTFSSRTALQDAAATQAPSPNLEYKDLTAKVQDAA